VADCEDQEAVRRRRARCRTLALFLDCRDGVRAFDKDGHEQNTELSVGQDRLSTGNLSELLWALIRERLYGQA
jgi:hypothetical protein